MNHRAIRIHDTDMVAVALEPLGAGSMVTVGEESIQVTEAIPQGHKFALRDIAEGERIIKYGFSIGTARSAIPRGAHVHTHNTATHLAETESYAYCPQDAVCPPPAVRAGTIQAYERSDGHIGIRNEIWIIPTVGCVNKVASSLAAWGNQQLANKALEGIDGIHAWEHPYGCSQLGADHVNTRTILADLVRHPNAGAVLVIGLGCENNTIEAFKEALGPYDHERVRFMVTQQVADEIAEGKQLLTLLASYAGQATRTTVAFSRLVVGLKCGGSDGLSGITANPLVGRFSDYLTAAGGSAILTEIPEMFGAEKVLMDRCVSREVFDRLTGLVNGFKQYFIRHGQVVYENPSPGNKAGGITTLEDKSLGCVQKGGTSPIKGVLGYGERIENTGLQILDGPGNDIVSTTAMAAAGAHLILFTTGRGTPLGSVVPTVKISTNTALARQKSGWMDFDAGRLLFEESPVVLSDLIDYVCDVASGRMQTKNEINGYHEIAIFKDGVTL
ncbi:MAG: UxaA family hydrolase [Sphaerochaetaceae bacterium]